MRYLMMVLWTLLWSVSSAMAQISIGIGLPGVSIGINFPVYPELVRVPGYPVYYAPQLNSNYFFYDGMYWVYQSDNWYASSWYNGPWGLVDRYYVPEYVLRVPVRYYRAPPGYFRGWRNDAPPRWGDHWGNDWQQRRSGWDRWDRNAVPAPAPLPVYQRQYSGNRYPQTDQQRTLHTQNYRYQPRDTAVRQHYQERIVQKPPASLRQDQRSAPQDQGPRDGPRPAAPQNRGDDMQRTDASRPKPSATQEQRQPPQRAEDKREPQRGQSSQERDGVPQGKGAPNEERQGRGQDKGRDKDDERGQERNR